jgi:hypothetical protein
VQVSAGSPKAIGQNEAAQFVGAVRAFQPSNFVELLDASLGLHPDA